MQMTRCRHGIQSALWIPDQRSVTSCRVASGMTRVARQPLRAILIAGPTASGKSALALELAERLNGALINADASQVYAELQVLSARPGAREMARVPHFLYGHVPAQERYSVARWLMDAQQAID